MKIVFSPSTSQIYLVMTPLSHKYTSLFLLKAVLSYNILLSFKMADLSQRTVKERRLATVELMACKFPPCFHCLVEKTDHI